MEHSPPTLRAVLLHIKQWTGFRCQRLGLRVGHGRWMLTLAAIPVVTFSMAYALTSPRVKPSPPPQPSYLDRVAPSDSFVQRFGSETPAVTRVRTISILRPIVQTAEVVHPQPVARPTETDVSVEREPPPRRRSIRYHYRGGDICSRHAMRKVMVGRYKWRCRR